MEQKFSVDQRAKAVRRIARRGGFPEGADFMQLVGMHWDDLCVAIGPISNDYQREIVEKILSALGELDGGKELLRALRPPRRGMSLTEVREEQALAENVTVKTIERREMKGAIAFVHQADELLARLEQAIDEEIKVDRESFLLWALIRELVRDNPAALERTEQYWAKLSSAVMPIGDEGIYGPRDIFLDKLGDALDMPFKPYGDE